MKGFAASAKAAMGKVALALAPLIAIQKVGNFMSSSVTAFMESEKASQRFAGALRAGGYEVDNNLAAMKALASEMQSLTVYEDDAITAAAQLGLSMGVSTTQMKEAVKGAIGLSSAFGVDLEQGMKMAAAALAGKYTMLGRYIPALKTAKTEGERMAIVQKAMANGFKIAQAEASTGAGKIESMKNAWGDFKEKIGEQLAPIVIRSLERLIPIAQGFFRFIGAAYHVAEGLWKGMEAGLASAAASFLEMLAPSLDAINKITGGDGDAAAIAGGLRNRADQLDLSAKNSLERAKDPFREEGGEEGGEFSGLNGHSVIKEAKKAMRPPVGSGFATASALDSMGKSRMPSVTFSGLDELTAEFKGVRSDLQKHNDIGIRR